MEPTKNERNIPRTGSGLAALHRGQVSSYRVPEPQTVLSF